MEKLLLYLKNASWAGTIYILLNTCSSTHCHLNKTLNLPLKDSWSILLVVGYCSILYLIRRFVQDCRRNQIVGSLGVKPPGSW